MKKINLKSFFVKAEVEYDDGEITIGTPKMEVTCIMKASNVDCAIEHFKKGVLKKCEQLGFNFIGLYLQGVERV